MCTVLAMSSGPIANPRLEVISSDDGFVVHDSERGLVHYLNETAAIVFSLCDGDRGPAAISKLVQEYFDLSERPDEDVQSVIGDLLEKGMLIDSGSTAD